jgi:hypothetical protein
MEAITDQELVAGRLRAATLGSREKVPFLKARMLSASALRKLVESQIQRHKIETHSRNVPAMSA